MENNASKHRIISKRTILFAVLFTILIVSSIFIVSKWILEEPLRIDTIPSDAYVVPWMQPNPSISILKQYQSNPYGPPPFNVDSVMANSLKLSMTFNITVSSGSRIIPSTVYLGHDMDYLYVGGEFRGMGLNPYNDANNTLANCMSIYFDVDDNGTLSFPEAGSRILVFVYNDTWTTNGLYDDLLWTDYNNVLQRASWVPAEAYTFPKAPAGMTLANGFAEYDNPTGTLTFIIARCLRYPAMDKINALQMQPGERWVMGFVLELAFGGSNGGMSNKVDGWPQTIFPFLSSDSSWWPKLAIDLSNSTA
jgi:hypothetical protein